MFKKIFRYLLVVLLGAGIFYLGGTNYVKFGKDIDLKHPFSVFNINPQVDVDIDTPTVTVDTPDIDDPNVNIDIDNPNIDVDIDKPDIGINVEKPTIKATKITIEKQSVKLNKSGNAALLSLRKSITKEQADAVMLKIRISEIETNEKYNRDLFENPSRKYEYSGVKLTRNKYAWHISKWLIRNDDNDFIYKDPYTNLMLRDQSKIDYDHIIAAKYAWEHGAYKWSDTQKNNWSYNIVNGVDVSSSANRSKGAKGPSDWLPIENPEDYCWSYFVIASTNDISMTKNDFNVCKLQIYNCLDTKECIVEEINRTVLDE